MPNIIPSNSIVTSEVTQRPDAKVLLRKSQDMIASSISFGFKRFMYYGAALYNIKTYDLHKLEFPSWKAFLEAHNLDGGDAHRYVGIGASIAQRLVEEGKIKEGDPILQKDVQALADENLERLKSLTFRELVELSKRVDIFDSAMNGQELQKLLPGKNDTTEDDTKKALSHKSERAEFNDHMKKVCESYGWKWNAKDERCEHEDGTPLTDEELGQITPPSSAIQVFTLAKLEVNKATQSLRDHIIANMKPYLRYNLATKNQALQRQAYEIRQELQMQFQEIIQMLDAVIEGDEARVKEIKKHGLEEV
jgi:hypothetical protein